MEIIVEDVFFLSQNGIVSFAVSVDPPAYELKKGWYYLIIKGVPVEKFWTEGEDYLFPFNASFRSISTKEFDKVKAHPFGEDVWTLVPVDKS